MLQAYWYYKVLCVNIYIYFYFLAVYWSVRSTTLANTLVTILRARKKKIVFLGRFGIANKNVDLLV